MKRIWLCCSLSWTCKCFVTQLRVASRVQTIHSKRQRLIQTYCLTLTTSLKYVQSPQSYALHIPLVHGLGHNTLNQSLALIHSYRIGYFYNKDSWWLLHSRQQKPWQDYGSFLATMYMIKGIWVEWNRKSFFFLL